MRIHTIQHVEFETPGSITDWCRETGTGMNSTFLFRGDTFPEINTFDVLVILGGPMSVNQNEEYPWLEREKHFIKTAIDNNKFVLGICLGAQLIASALGADVYPNQFREIGWFPVRPVCSKCPPLFRDVMNSQLEVFHWHGETFTLPDGAILLAESEACKNQGVLFQENVVGLQFHLETTADTARNLITNCSHEISDGPFINSAEQMLSDPSRFDRINQVMTQLLNNISHAVKIIA